MESKIIEELERVEKEREQQKANDSADAFLWALMQTGELKTLAALLKPKNGSR